MLGEDYPRVLESLIAGLPQSILLPPSQDGFFSESGVKPHFEENTRCAVRTRVRTNGVVIPQRWLPQLHRQHDPLLIYTKDFSKTGFGFVADRQFYPGEIVRVLLATFWIHVSIRRCRRLGPLCFECGGVLMDQHSPSLDAFD